MLDINWTYAKLIECVDGEEPMKPTTVFDFDQKEYRPCEVLDTNGNLTYVEFEDGSTDWVDNQSIEHRDW